MYTYKDGKYYKQTLQEIDSKDILTALELMNVGVKQKLELEDYNFKIDSTDWEIKTIDGIEVKINKEEDITEYTDGEYQGEQLFTFDAMIRETKKAGKRVPTDEEWGNFKKEDIKNMVYSGFRATDGITFYLRGYGAHLWSSSSSGSTAYGRYLGWSNAGVYRGLNDESYGFSVRCIKD